MRNDPTHVKAMLVDLVDSFIEARDSNADKAEAIAELYDAVIDDIIDVVECAFKACEPLAEVLTRRAVEYHENTRPDRVIN